MLTAADLIELDCEDGLIQAGVQLACRAASQPGRFPELNSFDRIRLLAGDCIADLALRRCLSRSSIPHQTISSPGFNQAGSSDVVLGGRRCLTAAQLICSRKIIRQLRGSPQSILDRKVYLPERVVWDAYGDEDLFVFAFVLGLVTRSREAIKKALVARQPIYLFHRMPPAWSLPEVWSPMEKLVIKTDVSKLVSLSLHGQDGHQRYLSQTLEVQPHTRTEINTDLFSIGALQIDRVPSGPVGIHSPLLGETRLVAPYQWGNVWLYGIRVVLAGYIRKVDFYRQAGQANPLEALSANPCLKRESLLALPAAALKPLPGLFRKVEAWTTG